jgi:hypothetical protein
MEMDALVREKLKCEERIMKEHCEGNPRLR